jgi:hypothetical protein
LYYAAIAKDKFAVSPAMKVLRAEKIVFNSDLYTYEEQGSTALSVRKIGLIGFMPRKLRFVSGVKRHVSNK